jgi:chemosensory pili system protein ChpA (sensor histidine kinase/response regulator)
VKTETNKTAIIVKEAGAMYALIVDGVLGREEIVIKSLGEELSKIPYISGGTVSGDGSVILILDIPSITQKIRADVDEPEEDFSAIERARKVISQDAKAATPKVKAKKKEPIKPRKVSIKKKKLSDRAPVALIVDDSVSVRKFVSSVLEKNKYQTVLAEDGPEALEELKKQEFDIIITDLEMPKMQGFDLIEEIRKQRNFQHIPIVILTGRAGKKHKERGVELGANAYITKPFKEGDLLNTLENFIEIA